MLSGVGCCLALSKKIHRSSEFFFVFISAKVLCCALMYDNTNSQNTQNPICIPVATVNAEDLIRRLIDESAQLKNENAQLLKVIEKMNEVIEENNTVIDRLTNSMAFQSVNPTAQR